ncbi:MAG: ATP-binding protein [Deltaproteobacteria bacterium]|nr:ATP-binding protein [Deltaproteobacteria bacterium]
MGRSNLRKILVGNTGSKNPAMTNMDRNEQFIMKQCATYLDRLLDRHDLIDDETFDFLHWILGTDIERIGTYLLSSLKDTERQPLEEALFESEFDSRAYAKAAKKTVQGSRKSALYGLKIFIQKTLRSKIRKLHCRSASSIERNLSALKKMFGLTDQETAFTLFFFVMVSYEPAAAFFDRHLSCDAFMGRKYLTALLRITHRELNDILSGKLFLTEFFRMDNFIQHNDDFLNLLQNPSNDEVSKSFYTRIARKTIPLERHLIDRRYTDHIVKLLKEKPKSSHHILLYGTAGTGKTCYAMGLAEHLGIPAYEIVRGDDNKSSQRRAAIIAALNMTNHGKGSLIIVDEADNILNTRFSFFMRGETQDKGWLNQLLEEPGARIIWITNSIHDIEESVLRRFAFSLHFKPFNRRQRMQVWESILRVNRVKRFFDRSDIEDLAKRYKVSAGAIDIAIKKAYDVGAYGRHSFKEAVITALEAHTVLRNYGRKEIKRNAIEQNYSLEGLNIEGNINTVINQIEAFDRYLRQQDNEDVRNMNLLFHGPPGTGKSELARYIANRLDREMITKRAIDFLDKYVGETEQKIREAFEEAENDEAILIIDEADTLLFSRRQAQRSWEISFINEFLTQMERYRGILICTTNRLKGLDEASMRRFNHKIGFNFLTPEGNVIFYQKLLAPLTSSRMDEKTEKSLMDINGLAPGDFRIVRDKFLFYTKEQVKHQTLIDALKTEITTRNFHKYGGERIGF